MKNYITQNFPPNSALSSLTPIIGEWVIKGKHGLLPDVELHGQASFEWHESGAFIIGRNIISDPHFPAGIQIVGSDNELGTITMIYYDNRGISRNYYASINGRELKWWRDANPPGFSQRYSLTFSGDGSTMESKGEICKDGKNWEQDLDLNYKKTYL